ncbi:MAG: hypothetical protein GY861_28355 [bacterium]|nr:hypothetical protein [bacterium]
MDTNNPIVDTTNLAAGTYYYELYLARHKNVLIQYEMTSGDTDNTLTMTIFGTVYPYAIKEVTTDWVDITDDLTDSLAISVNNSTEHDLTTVDTNIRFMKLKFVIVVSNTTPNNSLKIGFNA